MNACAWGRSRYAVILGSFSDKMASLFIEGESVVARLRRSCYRSKFAW
jgi:hypothetical protein